MKRRLWIVLTLFGVWLLALTARLYDLQVVEHERYTEIARRQQMDVVELDPPRGTIFDARGRELAVSVSAESLFADPRAIEDPSGTARRLAKVLPGLDEARLAAALDSERSFVWVRRKLDPPQAEAVRQLDIHGLGFVDESKRYYPFRQLAGHLLGFVGTDHTGLEGLEAQYDAVVAGEGARRTVLRDAYRQALASPELRFPEPRPGRDLYLTLDATIQHIVERELYAAVEGSGAAGGSAIVLDPWSGAILAMASLPLFDPNRFAEVDASHWRIRSITDVFEPGSTFKMITVATALEANLVDPDDLIDCERGGITISRKRIRDHHPYDLLTVRDVLAKSSNVGAIKIGLIAGAERLDQQVRAFGFGRASGVDLPGESPGLFLPRAQWAPMTDIYMSFGHGIAVTSLQLANSFAAVANGGVLYRPYIVAGTGRDGVVERQPPPEALGRVLHPATARSVERLLEAVVETGTARRAQIPGYRVAGKTGTPQKLDEGGGGYSNSRYMASFVGFAPARRAAVVCLVMIDEPRGGAEGGVVAAPTFQAIVRSVLNYLKVPPEDPVEPAWPRLAALDETAAEGEVVAADDGVAALDALAELAEEGTEGLTEIADGTVTAPEELAALDPESDVGIDPDVPVLPDVSGLTARQAMTALTALGVVPRLNGAGFVVRQSPAAGTPLSEVGEGPELWLAAAPSVS
jgi:cell division protein FtsI (penicillin-binding protein 3)